MLTYHDPLVALHDITLNLLSEDSPEELLHSILQQALQATSAESGSISLLSDDKKHLDIKVQESLSVDPAPVRLRVGEGVTGRCILTGKTKNIGNVKEDPHYIEIRTDILSELACPLKIGRKTFGVISIDSTRKNAFTEEHETIMEMLADYAALIFSRIQGNHNLIHRTKMLDLLLVISSNLGTRLRLQELFDAAISELKKNIPLNYSSLHLYNENLDQLSIESSYNYSESEIKKSIYKPGEGITGKVFKSGQHLIIDNVSEEKSYLNKSGKDHSSSQQESYIGCPITMDGKCVGVYGLAFDSSGKSDQEDIIFVARMLASFFGQGLQINNLIEKRGYEVEKENENLRERLESNYSFSNIIGTAPSMRDIFHKIKLSANVPSPVLILGESGTGKELIASALHENSERKKSNLIKVNCAAIPDDLLESELFGSVKGAYTSSVEDRKGKLVEANGGTLFLDEIGDMPFKLQSKILRVIQEKEFSPLGSDKVIKVDVRVIAATNANLETLIREKSFREDLYYRLNVIRLDLPPLRERKSDLPALSQTLLKRIISKTGKKVKGIKPEAMEVLESYDYPGNIRELENILERAIVLTSNQSLLAEDITIPKASPITVAPVQEELPAKEQASFSLTDWVKKGIEEGNTGQLRASIINDVDKELIRILLNKNRYNKSKTATQLGINRLTLDKKIAELGLMDEF